MQTEVLAGERAIERAVELLRAGEVVALPTETVYGLAADALNAGSVAKIFEAKERPRFDPLIVHLPTREWLGRVAHIDSELVNDLASHFWPGPLTLVLPKSAAIPDIVTAGLESVAVRMSAHPIFARIIAEFGRPLAAPSANRFGRISATAAAHVYDELAERIPLIVDGGSATHGIESTIVRIVDGAIEVLRPGPVMEEMLAQFGAVRVVSGARRIIAPGQLPSHYAPRTKLILVDDVANFAAPSGSRFGLLSLRLRPSSRPERSEVEGPRDASLKAARRNPSARVGMTFAVVRELSSRGDLREAAANLFRMLRELDAAHLDLIVAEKVANEGIGAAINDRLQRAASSSQAVL